jgi:hypothetical protein
MNAPERFSQFTAGSSTSRGQGANLTILGSEIVRVMGIPFLYISLSNSRSTRSTKTLSEKGFQPRRDQGLPGEGSIYP